MKNHVKDLLKVAGATALTLTLATSAFIGANSIAFAAATQPEILPVTDDIKSAYEISQIPTGNEPQLNEAPQPEYKEPTLTVIMDENLDENGKPYYTPGATAMSPEEAAQIGARYIWDMLGESIDGKTVLMSYSAWPSHSGAYWQGTVGNSEKDVNPPEPSKEEIAAIIAKAEEGVGSGAVPDEYSVNALYSFSIDAVTGEWVSIHPWLNIPAPTDLGEGKTYTLSPVEFEALQHEAPANVEEYAAVAREFAQKHFKHSTVVSVEFVRRSVNQGGVTREEIVEIAKAYQEAYREDKDKPITFTLYEKGNNITFNVTDSMGRVAWVLIDMDSKQVIFLDTSDSDFIPGYHFGGEGGVG
jgi:hypothetical protein